MACLKRWVLGFTLFVEIKMGEVRRNKRDLQTQVKRIRDFNGNRLRISIINSMGKLNTSKSNDEDGDRFGGVG